MGVICFYLTCDDSSELLNVKLYVGKLSSVLVLLFTDVSPLNSITLREGLYLVHSCPQHIGTEQVLINTGWVNWCKNLLSNFIPPRPPDPKRYTHFIDGEETLYKVQQIAQPPMIEPGIRFALMTFLLTSTLQATLAGVEWHWTWLTFLRGSLSQSTSLAHWVMGWGERGTWGESRTVLLDRCAQGALGPSLHTAWEVLHRGEDGATTETSHQVHSPLSQEYLKGNT